MKRTIYFVGIHKSGARHVFRATTGWTPEEEVYRPQGYVGFIGPHRTKRGARYMATHGRNNPHAQTADDADRLAALHYRLRDAV